MRCLSLCALTLTLAACSSKPEVPPPMIDGSYLTYQVRETGDSQATLRFKKTDDGFTLSMQANGGQSTVQLDEEAQAPDKKIVLPLQSGPLDLAVLWLPPASRKSGALTPAGRVGKRQSFEQWQVLKIDRSQPSPETRFYEVNTGVLVGWRMNRGTLDIGGKLVDSQ